MKNNRAPKKQGLYDPQFEHDACGVGFVVNMKGSKSHEIVQQALTVLVNLDHRGACGCEPNTGDGAGILIQMPDTFLHKACALLGIECVVYMGEEDTRRQALNVARMKLLGAEVVPVLAGSRTLKDAINEAMRDWVTNVDRTHYLLGTVTGPSPFPEMVRTFHQVIGLEAREQVLELTGGLPTAVAACVGGGSNAMGIFAGFLNDPVDIFGVEPLGRGAAQPGRSAGGRLLYRA